MLGIPGFQVRRPRFGSIVMPAGTTAPPVFDRLKVNVSPSSVAVTSYSYGAPAVVTSTGVEVIVGGTFECTVSVYERVAERPDVSMATTLIGVVPMPLGVHWMRPVDGLMVIP